MRFCNKAGHVSSVAEGFVLPQVRAEKAAMRTTFHATTCCLWMLFVLKSHALKAQRFPFCSYLTLASLGKPLIQVLHKAEDCFTSSHQGIEFKLWTGKIS